MQQERSWGETFQLWVMSVFWILIGLCLIGMIIAGIAGVP